MLNLAASQLANITLIKWFEKYTILNKMTEYQDRIYKVVGAKLDQTYHVDILKND